MNRRFITCRWLPPFFEYRYRVVWSHIEQAPHYSQIQHPVVREVLTYLDLPHGIALHHDGDLPARTGLGSSSAFTVGLLHALYGLTGRTPTKMQLAQEAIYIEQERLAEHVGCQDQLAAAFGGFLLLFAAPEAHREIAEALHPLLHVPIEFETLGSRLIFSDTNGYTPQRLTQPRRSVHEPA